MPDIWRLDRRHVGHVVVMRMVVMDLVVVVRVVVVMATIVVGAVLRPVAAQVGLLLFVDGEIERAGCVRVAGCRLDRRPGSEARS